MVTVSGFPLRAASAGTWRKETQIVWPKFRGDLHGDLVFGYQDLEVIRAYKEQRVFKKRNKVA